MKREIIVTHTQTRTGEPIATISGFPGFGADMTPEQMRSLASALIVAASTCEATVKKLNGYRMQSVHLFA